jgi:hypothetical protein
MSDTCHEKDTNRAEKLHLFICAVLESERETDTSPYRGLYDTFEALELAAQAPIGCIAIVVPEELIRAQDASRN